MKVILTVLICILAIFAFGQANSDLDSSDILTSLSDTTSRSERRMFFEPKTDSIRKSMTRKEIKSHQMYVRGRADALEYYKAKNGVYVVLTGMMGIPVYLLTTPLPLHTPDNIDHQLVENPIYYLGYRSGVRKKKTGKILIGAAVLMPIAAIFVILFPPFTGGGSFGG